VTSDTRDTQTTPELSGLVRFPFSSRDKTGESPRRRVGGSRRVSGWSTAVLFMVPAIIVIGVFHLYAAGRNVWMSFTNWTLAGADFIGLDNYVDLIRGGDFWNSLKVTLFFTTAVPITILVAIPVAYLLHFVVRKSYAYRLLLFVPFIVPTVATSLVWGLVFAPGPTGLLNASLNQFGVPRQSWVLDSKGIFEVAGGWIGLDLPTWAAGPSVAMAILILIRFWQMLGFTVLILYAGMTRIDHDLLDAARVDGATESRILRRVVVPVLSPTILFVTVISLVYALREFNTIFVLTQGGPARTTETLSMLMFRQFWGDHLLGVGATTATVLFLLIMAITWVQFRLSRRWVHYSGGRA
jgi:multiple sugar transport system permease protein